MKGMFVAKRARKHHYLPQFYLEGFTPTGKREDFLWVGDLEKKEQRRSRPSRVALETDYYLVTGNGNEEDELYFEKYLSRIESRVAPIMRDIRDSHILPVGDALGDLLLFALQLLLRVPKWRKMMRKSHMETGRLISEQTLQSRERWESIIQRMRAEGEVIPEGVSYEDVKEAYDNGEIIHVPNQAFELQSILRLTLELHPLMLSRNWSLAKSADLKSGFVVGDSPLVAFWSRPMPDHVPIGFGLEDTIVFFPVSSHQIMLGTWEPSVGASGVGMDRDLVGMFNRHSLLSADRYIFAASDDCRFLLQEEALGSFSEICNLLRRR